MFEKDIQAILANCVKEATSRGHEFICVEHLLFVLMNTPETRIILEACEANFESLENSLLEFFQEKLEVLPTVSELDIQQTLGFQRVLQRAILHSEYSSADRLRPGDLLASVFTETDSHAVFYLNESGVTRLDVLEFISHGDDEENETESYPTSGEELYPRK